MKRKIISVISIVSLVSLLSVSTGCHWERHSNKEAVRSQLKHYPESTLQDIYKSFFQDEFGPGHLLGDTALARSYFDFELSEMKSRGRYEAEPCGTGNHFYRVPMDLVKDSLISYMDYFNAFLASAASFKVPEISKWKEKWDILLKDIEKMKDDIPGFGYDSQKIAEMLDQGKVMIHHSDAYIENYDPHYRIMSKQEWEKIKKLMKN